LEKLVRQYYRIMKFTVWIFIVMIFWMFIASGIVFGLYLTFNIPEEIIGPGFFLIIGIVISTVMNYYK